MFCLFAVVVGFDHTKIEARGMDTAWTGEAGPRAGGRNENERKRSPKHTRQRGGFHESLSCFLFLVGPSLWLWPVGCVRRRCRSFVFIVIIAFQAFKKLGGNLQSSLAFVSLLLAAAARFIPFSFGRGPGGSSLFLSLSLSFSLFLRLAIRASRSSLPVGACLPRRRSVFPPISKS